MSIDWNQVLISAGVGGAVGGAAMFLRRAYAALARRFGAARAAILLAAAALALGVALFESPLGTWASEALARRRSSDRIARIAADSMAPVLASPELRRRIEGMSADQVGALAMQLSQQGLLRLSDPQLIRRMHLLDEALVASSEATCAASLTSPSPQDVQALLSNLSDASLREWSEMSAQASMATLRNDPPRSLSAAEVQTSVQRIIAALPEAEGERLAAALAKPAGLDPEAACWTAKTLYETAARLAPEDQALVARVLATQ